MDSIINLVTALSALLKNPATWIVLGALLAYWLFSAAVGAMEMPQPRPATGPDPDRRYRYWFRLLNRFAGNLKRAAKALHVPGSDADDDGDNPPKSSAAAGSSTLTAMLLVLALSVMCLLVGSARAQTDIRVRTATVDNIVYTAAGAIGVDMSAVLKVRVKTAAGVPGAGSCDEAGEVGSLYVRSNPAATTSSLYVCANTAVATFAWELVQTTATVTHTTGALGANEIVLGNGTGDIKTLGTKGTTTTVVHGNAGGAPSFGAVVEADQTLADNTTNDCTIAKHGYVPKAPNDTTKYLRGDCTWATVPYSTDVQIFTSNGTWTKPSGAKSVTIVLVGAGGGAGSGRRGAAASVRGGGGGGGGGTYSRVALPASILGATETVTVGVGGPGGAAIAADNTNGTFGTAGGATSFGNWIRATGGTQGSGGTTAGGAGGAAGSVGTGGCGGDGGTGGATVAAGAGKKPGQCAFQFAFDPGTGDASSTFTAEGVALAAAGGGGGGGITAANVIVSAAAGGQGALPHGSTITAGTSGGTTVVGGAGASVTANEPIGGAGGGGGSANGAANNTGGAGGLYGAGGGGGGASVNGANSGAGGAGANGLVVVITNF